MLTRFAADVVVLLHLMFIVFVVAGGFAVVWLRRFAWLHIPCAVWGAWIALTGGVCPLTPLENKLRAAAGQAGYSGGFFEHYVIPLVYPPGLTPRIQLMLGIAVIIINLGAYGTLFLHHFRPGNDTE